MLIDRKWQTDIYVIDKNSNEYLVQSRPKHYSKKIKNDRLVDIIELSKSWVEGLYEDFNSEDIQKEMFKDGKFNVHYKWNNQYKEDKWIDVEDIESISFEIYDVNKTLKSKKLFIYREYHAKEQYKGE